MSTSSKMGSNEVTVTVIRSKADFDEILKDCDLVAVDFTAKWCGPCKIIGPKFDEMALEFTSVRFFKVDVDENDELNAEYSINAMPTFMFFKYGKKVDELVGASEVQLRNKIQKLSA